MTDVAPAKRSWGRRMLILTTAVVLAIAGWFVLGESESVVAAEGKGSIPSAHDLVPVTTTDEAVLATVNGEPISEAQTVRSIQGQLLALDRQRHALLAEALEGEILGVLIAGEAEKRGLSTDDLLRVEVEEKADSIADDTVEAFYQAQRQQHGDRLPAKTEIENEIRQFLALDAFHAHLRDAAKIDRSLEPFRVDVAALGPAKGPDNAPVTMVVFSDFECPYCGRVIPMLDQVQKAYGDKVRIVFRQFPLEQLHPNARNAGIASLCANEQGLFWPMHDALFADQRNLGDGIKIIAARVDGLDMGPFRTCLEEARFDGTINRDLEDGARAGVTGTPALFINGRFLGGVAPFEQVAAILDEELAAQG